MSARVNTTTSASKGGRPAGSKARPLAARLAEKTDRMILKVLRGVPAFHADGRPLLDEDGKQVMKLPSASHVRAAVARLATLGAGAPGSPYSEQVRREAQGRAVEAVGRGEAADDADLALVFSDSRAREAVERMAAEEGLVPGESDRIRRLEDEIARLKRERNGAVGVEDGAGRLGDQFSGLVQEHEDAERHPPRGRAA